MNTLGKFAFRLQFVLLSLILLGIVFFRDGLVERELERTFFVLLYAIGMPCVLSIIVILFCREDANDQSKK